MEMTEADQHELITVQLHPQMWNIVVASLGKQPYEIVAPVLRQIEQQFMAHEAAKKKGPRLVDAVPPANQAGE